MVWSMRGLPTLLPNACSTSRAVSRSQFVSGFRFGAGVGVGVIGCGTGRTRLRLGIGAGTDVVPDATLVPALSCPAEVELQAAIVAAASAVPSRATRVERGRLMRCTPR